ncbi:hypothetical protein JL721_7287 [Aureococcus anophagefferens]|nr:hypothetical protein JL721_7287 [Aureococcus anophagefferens]
MVPLACSEAVATLIDGSRHAQSLTAARANRGPPESAAVARMMRIALVALAAALAAPPDDDAAAPDGDAAGVDWQRRRVVRVFASPFAGSSEAPAYAMTDALGRGYTCGLDGAAVAKRRGAGGAPSAAASAIEGYKAWRDSSRECAALALKEEYWHYELCPGRSARQFKPPGAAARRRRRARREPRAGRVLVRRGRGVAGGGRGRLRRRRVRDAAAGRRRRRAGGAASSSGGGGGACSRTSSAGSCTSARRRAAAGPSTPTATTTTRTGPTPCGVAAVVEARSSRTRVASPLACAPRDLRTAVAAQAAAKLEGKCLRRRWRGDWWTYEVSRRRAPVPPAARRDHDGFGVLPAADAAASRDPGLRHRRLLARRRGAGDGRAEPRLHRRRRAA